MYVVEVPFSQTAISRHAEFSRFGIFDGRRTEKIFQRLFPLGTECRNDLKNVEIKMN